MNKKQAVRKGQPQTISGAAALIVVLFYVIQIIVFVVSPPPSTVIGYFTLLHKNGLLGLLDLDLLSIADYALFVPMFLALYIALRRANQSFMAIATILGFVGIAAYFASNTAFNMLSLSSQYAAATTDAQRSRRRRPMEVERSRSGRRCHETRAASDRTDDGACKP